MLLVPVVIAIIALAIALSLREATVVPTRLARWAQRSALVLMGLYATLLMVLGIAEMTTGIISGASHLVHAMIIVILALLAWRWPYIGGLALVVFGAAASGFFIVMVAGPSAEALAVAAVALPLLVAGVLFLATRTLVRSAPTSGEADRERPKVHSSSKR